MVLIGSLWANRQLYSILQQCLLQDLSLRNFNFDAMFSDTIELEGKHLAYNSPVSSSIPADFVQES